MAKRLIKTEIDFNGYWVKGITSHYGHEGEKLMQCSVYKDGIRFAVYSDGDWGGPSTLHPIDLKAKKAMLKTFEEHAKSLGKESWEIVYDMMNAFDTIRQLKKQAKNRALFAVLKDQPKDGSEIKYRRMNCAWEPKTRDGIYSFLNGKYGKNQYIILNEQLPE